MSHHSRCALPGHHGLLTVGRGALAVAAFALMTAVAGGVAAANLNAPAPLAADAPAAAAPRTDGFDPATCRPQPAVPAAAPAVADTGSQATAVVSLVVPATTRIDVDELGRPVAVSTNTGQAPCVTDQFLRVAPDGTGTPADHELSTAVLSVQLGDDWQPGVAQPLAAG